LNSILQLGRWDYWLQWLHCD